MQNKKLPSLITILVLTLITALMWVGFTVYRAFTSSPTPSVPEEISSPLTPTLDTSIVGKIESAIFFNESQIPEISATSGTPVSAPATPLPAPTATPVSSPSATPVASATPTSTP